LIGLRALEHWIESEADKEPGPGRPRGRNTTVKYILERIVAKLREQSNRLREGEDRQYRRHRRELELNRGSAQCGSPTLRCEGALPIR
jgi:hypothetical protein